MICIHAWFLPAVQATRNPLCDSLKASYAVANEALDLEDDDLADEVGDDALFFFLFGFLGPPLATSGKEGPSCWRALLLSGKISMGIMLLGCSKSAEAQEVCLDCAAVLIEPADNSSVPLNSAIQLGEVSLVPRPM